MVLYRYEMPDGGGPYVTPDGYIRGMSKEKQVDGPYTDGFKYCCKSIKELKKYFLERTEPFFLKQCEIKIYEVPDNLVKYNGYSYKIPFAYKPVGKINENN